MKKLGVVAALCLLFSQPAFAMVPLTPNAVQSAQAYGVERKGASLSEVLAPWTVYDRKQMNPYGLRERVVVYTPYLTAAVDARSTANNGDAPTVDQGMKVAKQYDGVLALGVNLSTTVKLDASKLKVKLYQGQGDERRSPIHIDEQVPGLVQSIHLQEQGRPAGHKDLENLAAAQGSGQFPGEQLQGDSF